MAQRETGLRWIEGRIVRTARGGGGDLAEPFRRSALPTCYSTARVTAGVAQHLERHVARLERDAAQVGIGKTDAVPIERAYRELALEAFGDAVGIVRVEVCQDVDGRVRVAAEAFDLGPEPATWTAITVPVAHHGHGRWSGAKLLDMETILEARRLSDEARTDEALMLDRAGRLVEGARANIIVVTAQGDLVSPDLGLGSVAGIARAIFSEAFPELEGRILSLDEIRQAREILATNAVRGACPIVLLDGRPVGSGEPGPWSGRLAQAFEAD